jgi:hypothetical protein
MPLFLRIQKIFIKILTKIKKNRRRINKSFLEKSIFNFRPMPGSVFVKYFNPTILCFELDEYERESYPKPFFIFILTLESLASHIYKLYCESDIYDFVSNLFINDDNQEMITSILMLLQDIAHFDSLVSIRKFTEAAESLDDNSLCTIFKKTSNE